MQKSTIIIIFLVIILPFIARPVFSIFSEAGGLFTLLLGVSNLLYLSSRAKKPLEFFLWLTPVLFLLLFFGMMRHWGQNTSGSPIGIGLLGAGIIYVVCIGVFITLETATIISWISDLPRLKTLFLGWPGKELKDWLVLIMLLPLAVHLYTVFQYGPVSQDIKNLKPRVIQVRNRPASFYKGTLEYKGGLFHRTLREGVLTQKTLLTAGQKPVWFSPDKTICFYDNQSVQSGHLGTDTVFVLKGNPVKFLKDEPIEFYRDGSVKRGYLAQDTLFELVRYHKKVAASAGSDVSFYNDGSLQSFCLKADQVFQTISGEVILQSSKYSALDLYQDGSLAAGTLANNARIRVKDQWLSFKKDEAIRFYPDGGVKSGVLVKRVTFRLKDHSFTAKEDESIYFYNDGSLKKAVNAVDRQFLFAGTLQYLPGELRFSPEGILIGQRIGNNEIIQNPQGQVICKLATGVFNYRGVKIRIDEKHRVYIHHPVQSQNNDIDAWDRNPEIDAIGYWYDDCREILAKNGIQLRPEDREPDLLVMFHYADVAKETIRELLFLEKTVIIYQNKRIECLPFQWVRRLRSYDEA